MEQIGTILRNLRTERGFTQTEVAAAISVISQAVSKWENGSGCPDRHGSALQQSAPQYTHDLPLR